MDSHFSILGKIITSWSTLELQIAHTVAIHSNSKVLSVMFSFENMTTRAKLETARAIISIEGFEDLRKELLPRIEEAKKLAKIRHAAAHSVWLGLSGRGHMIAVNVEAGGQGAHVGRVSWAVREFEATIRRINDLAKELKALTDEYLWAHGHAEDFPIPLRALEEPDYT